VLSLSLSVCVCTCFDVWVWISVWHHDDYLPRHTVRARYDSNNAWLCVCVCVCVCVYALEIGIGFDRRRVAASSSSFRTRSRSRGGGIMKIKWRIKKRGRGRSMRTRVSRDAALAARGRKGRERVTGRPAKERKMVIMFLRGEGGGNHVSFSFQGTRFRSRSISRSGCNPRTKREGGRIFSIFASVHSRIDSTRRATEMTRGWAACRPALLTAA